MNTSFSALNTFKICPLKYKYQNVDKIKAKKSPEAIFGTLMHDTMKFIHSGSFTNPSLKEALNHFSTHWNPDVFDDETKERIAFAQGIKIIQEYYRINDPSNVKIIDLESRFTIELEEAETGKKHLVSGFIDRIDKTDDGFEIIDYKTSKKMPPQKNVDENLQLLIYLMAFISRYPKSEKNINKIKLSLYFLFHGAKLSSTKSKDQLLEGKKDIIKSINDIESSDFPAIVGPLCGWCEYQKICPMWKHKFKKEPTTENEKDEIIKQYIEAQANSKNERKKATELQQKIIEIMEQEGVERLFGLNKIISKTHRKSYCYDEKKLKSLLQEEGLWDNVLVLNQTLLNKVVETLSTEKKKKVEKLKELKSESWGLSVKKD